MSHLQDISSRGVLHSKQKLEDKSKTKILWYEFLQIDHLFKALNFRSVLDWDLTMFELMLRSSAMTLRGFISKCYSPSKIRSGSTFDFSESMES